MKNLPELTAHFPKPDLPPLRDKHHMVFAVPLEWDRFWYSPDIDILLLGMVVTMPLGGGCYSG